MARATKYRDLAHARIYARWLELPTWRVLSAPARCLLVEVMGRFRPGDNGEIKLPVRLVAQWLNVSKATAARLLNELEANGWLAAVTVGQFGGKAKAGTYTLAMFANDVTGEPATREYEYLPGHSSHRPRRSRSRGQSWGDNNVPPARLDGFSVGTSQSHGKAGGDVVGVEPIDNDHGHNAAIRIGGEPAVRPSKMRTR
jgi:hypothetical protein